MSGSASTGGVIQNSCGNWLLDLCTSVDLCSITGAELWGVYQGLTLAWNEGFKKVIVESDSLSVVRMIQKRELCTNAHSSLLEAIWCNIDLD